MTTMDIVAATAGALASGWLAIRAYMLKPAFQSWCSAPGLVWASLLLLSVICGIVALSIVRTGVPATPREALLLIGLAWVALVMLINLHRQAPGRHQSPAE
ncbi:hypothetical protein [Caulobacter sp. BP25]|uniref:hypothetical protein n=1 Tax=Caulobacter sp. BP25 TaxID=2048900 RepID=UPI000C12B063|nr:hypothetical protein [Caulobacter sp. BP25]PHY20941.1 hypothetical protein CSW59_06955 [Caulobacter sp. BP25]